MQLVLEALLLLSVGVLVAHMSALLGCLLTVEACVLTVGQGA